MNPDDLAEIEAATTAVMLEHAWDLVSLELDLQTFFGLVAMVQLAARHPNAPVATTLIVRDRLDRAIANLPDELGPLRQHLILGWTEDVDP